MASLGQLYRPIIPHALPASVLCMVVNVWVWKNLNPTNLGSSWTLKTGITEELICSATFQFSVDVFLSHLPFTVMGKQSLEFADMTPYNGNCCPLFLFPLCCTTHIICLAVPLVYELLFAIQVLTLRLLVSYIYIYMEHLFLMFLDHTQRRSTVGRTPLDE